MKKTFKYLLEIYKQTIDTSKFKLIFLLSLLVSIYAVFGIAFSDDYIMGFFNIFWNLKYVTCVLLLVLMSIINTFQIFNKNQYFIIRIYNKKEYLKQLLLINCLSTFTVVIINIIFVMIGLNIFNNNIPIDMVKNYEMNAWIYFIFIILKFIFLTHLISSINVLLFKLFNTKMIVIINIIFYIFMMFKSFTPKLVSSIIEIPLFIGNYFGYQEYSSFLFEVLCTILYCFILYVISLILTSIVLKQKKGIFE